MRKCYSTKKEKVRSVALDRSLGQVRSESIVTKVVERTLSARWNPLDWSKPAKPVLNEYPTLI
jgi:hypothetical protein